MDRSLLLQWLDLPAGAWPPDPYTLLGLDESTADARQAEARTLTLMGKLRSHQLKHPELVTLGMNQLAEALLHVSSRGPRPAEVKPQPTAKPIVAKPIALSREPIEPVVKTVRPIKPLPPITLPVTIPKLDSPDRRRGYQELAQLRRLREALHQLGPTIGNPDNSLATPGDIYRFLDGMDRLENAISSYEPSDWDIDMLLPTIAVMVRQRHRLSIFRSLEEHQRRRLTAEWERAETTLKQHHQEWRTGMTASRQTASKRKRGDSQWNKLTHWETILGMLCLLILMIAVIQYLADR